MKIRLLFILCLSITSLMYAQPANDSCSNAEILTVTSTAQTVTFDTTTAQIENSTSCINALDYLADVWYEITMPYDGNLYVKGAVNWNYFALFDDCLGTQLQCGNNNVLFEGLTSGITYKLRVFRVEAQAAYSNQSFEITAFEKPTNNDCSNAEILNLTSTTQTVNFNVSGAIPGPTEDCTGNTSTYSGVWFNFTMPYNGNVYINGAITQNLFALYDTCSGTQLQCGSGEVLFKELTSGTNYKLHVFRTPTNATNTNYQSFDITAFEKPLNDDCNNAEPLTVSSTSQTVNFNVGGTIVNNEEGCTGTTNDYADVWYEITMPYNGNLTVDGAIIWNNFALYDACGGTQLQCGSQSQLFSGLTSGTTYILRVFRTEDLVDDDFQSFDIKAIEKPLNDDCNNAEALAVTSTTQTVNFDISGATVNNEEGCTGTTNDYVDLWYEITMPYSGNLAVEGLISWNNFALYDACGGIQMQCDTQGALFSGLTSGDTYKLRVFRTSVNATTGYQSFTIQAIETVANDDCANAEVLTVSETSQTIYFNTGGAVVNTEEGCTGTTSDYADVWYEVTMPYDGELYINGIIGWTNMALYDSCGGTQLQCGNNTATFGGLTSGTTYKLRIFRNASTASNTYQYFSIAAYQQIINDDCASAKTLNISSSELTVDFETNGATINNEIGCDGTAVDAYVDVWYEFTMPYSGSITINTPVDWNNFALYDTCSGKQLNCMSGELSGTLSGLINGKTYKLRVFRTSLNANFSKKYFTIKTTNTLKTENDFLSGVNIYPNPADKVLYISAPVPVDTITIHDINGRVILKKEFTTILNVSALPSGLYFITLINQNSKHTQKLIIKK